MKVAIFTPTFLPKCSGAEIFHHNLALRLQDRGHKPIVLMPRSLKRRLDSSPLAPPYETVGFPSHQWSLFKRWPAAAFGLSRWTLGRLQSRYRFDVWHSVVLSPAGMCFADWQSRTGVPGLVRAVGDDVPGNPALLPVFARKALCKAQCIVSLSEGMTRALAGLNIREDRIVEIANAVDLQRFEGCFDREAFLRRHGINGPVCLCVARNHPQKDLPTLFQAFREFLRDPSRRATLVVAGRGMPDYPVDADLKSHVRLLETAASSPLEFPPAELVAWYRAADLFVLTSQLEGFSTALLEAMAAGLPVAGTDVPGIRERVQNGVNGLLRPAGDTAGISATIARLLANPEERRAFGKASQQLARQYSWEQTMDAYESTYKKLQLTASRPSA